MHPILIRNYLSRAFNGPLNDKIKTYFLFVSVVVVVRFSIDLLRRRRRNSTIRLELADKSDRCSPLPGR